MLLKNDRVKMYLEAASSFYLNLVSPKVNYIILLMGALLYFVFGTSWLLTLLFGFILVAYLLRQVCFFLLATDMKDFLRRSWDDLSQ